MVAPTRMKLEECPTTQGFSYRGAYKLWLSGAVDGVQLPSDTPVQVGSAHVPPKGVGNV